jgi:hypothetical protein
VGHIFFGARGRGDGGGGWRGRFEAGEPVGCAVEPAGGEGGERRVVRNRVAVFGELVDKGRGSGETVGVVVEMVVEDQAAGDKVGFEGCEGWMVVGVGFGLVAAGVRSVAQDINVTEYTCDEMGVCDLREGGKRVLRGVEMLNDESHCAGLFPDDGVVAIFVSLDCATVVSDLAESPLQTFFDDSCDFTMSFVSSLAF